LKYTEYYHVEVRSDKKKKNIKLSLCIIKNYAIKAYREVEVGLHAFLTPALAGDE
jgi:hypothetical protein